MEREYIYLPPLRPLQGRYIQINKSRVGAPFGLTLAVLALTFLLIRSLDLIKNHVYTLSEETRAMISSGSWYLSLALGVSFFVLVIIREGIFDATHSRFPHVPMYALYAVVLFSSIGFFSILACLPSRAATWLSSAFNYKLIQELFPESYTMDMFPIIHVFSFLVAFGVWSFQLWASRPKAENKKNLGRWKRFFRFIRAYISEPYQALRDFSFCSVCSWCMARSYDFAVAMGHLLLFREHVLNLYNNNTHWVFGIFSLLHTYVFSVLIVGSFYFLFSLREVCMLLTICICLMLIFAYILVFLMGFANSMASEWAEFESVKHQIPAGHIPDFSSTEESPFEGDIPSVIHFFASGKYHQFRKWKKK